MKAVQILLSIISFLMLGNVGLFYYASMSQYFLFCATATVLYAIGLFHIYKNAAFHSISPIELLFFAWFIHIVIHALTTNNEEYKLYYLISCYLLFQGLTWLWKSKHLSFKDIKLLFIGLSVYESIICILQWTGIMESKIRLFKVSGTWESPNVTAMFIALCFPLLFERILSVHNKHKIGFVFLSVLELTALLAINCRTAYIGTAFSIFIQCALHFEWFNKVRHTPLKRLISLSLPISLAIILGTYGLYKMKQPSADGRLFIWKTSLSMIAEHPLKGYGYGMFEKEYYSFQNDYFIQNEGTETERRNARHIFVCYNDFLEQAIEGGVISSILYFGILITALCQSIRQREYTSMLFISNTIWISTVNFCIHATPLMFISIIFLAHTASNTKQYLLTSKMFIYIITAVGITVSLPCISSLICKYRVQRAVKQATDIRKQNFPKALNILKGQERNAGTSECFWRIYGKFLLQAKKYEHAQYALNKALEYTSNPSVHNDLKRCKQLWNNDK